MFMTQFGIYLPFMGPEVFNFCFINKQNDNMIINNIIYHPSMMMMLCCGVVNNNMIIN